MPDKATKASFTTERIVLSWNESQNVCDVVQIHQQQFGIDVVAVLLRSEVQGGLTPWVAIAAKGYHLALADAVTLRDIDLAQVRIGRRDAALVLDGHKQAVVRYRARERHGALARRPHCCAGRHSVVDSSVTRTKLVGRRLELTNYLGVDRCYERLAGG